jgi:hypothetical protein
MHNMTRITNVSTSQHQQKKGKAFKHGVSEVRRGQEKQHRLRGYAILRTETENPMASILQEKLVSKMNGAGISALRGKMRRIIQLGDERDVSLLPAARRLAGGSRRLRKACAKLAQEPRLHRGSSTTRTSSSTRGRNDLLHATIFLSDSLAITSPHRQQARRKKKVNKVIIIMKESYEGPKEAMQKECSIEQSILSPAHSRLRMA